MTKTNKKNHSVLACITLALVLSNMHPKNSENVKSAHELNGKHIIAFSIGWIMAKIGRYTISLVFFSNFDQFWSWWCCFLLFYFYICHWYMALALALMKFVSVRANNYRICFIFERFVEFRKNTKYRFFLYILSLIYTYHNGCGE